MSDNCVVEQLKLNSLIEGSYLVGKKLNSFPDMSFYAIVVKVKDYDELRVELSEEVVNRLEFPGALILISWNYATESLKEACHSANRAVLFRNHVSGML